RWLPSPLDYSPAKPSASPSPPFRLPQEVHAVRSTAGKQETTDYRRSLSYSDGIGLFQPELFMFSYHLTNDNDCRRTDLPVFYMGNDRIHGAQGHFFVGQ